MLPSRRDSYAVLREQMRWRVALVLATLIALLMVALGALNLSLGIRDNAQLAFVVLAVSVVCVAALVLLPRGLGGTIFFTAIGLLLVLVPVYGWYHGRGMQHWAYVFPPVLVFLWRSRPALAGMIGYGVFATALFADFLPLIDVVRFAAGYGLLACFMFTYALLQERAAAMLRYHSDHDALSNCLNRRTFNEMLDALEHGTDATQCCTFLLLDIDHFKAINDSHGHLVGDRIITEVAAALGRELGSNTPLFRYGGEEFAVLLAGADASAGAALAERLRVALVSGDFHGVTVTASIGVAEWRAGAGTVTAALAAADQALYDAKRSGRNRVVVANAVP
jgi:diguanylate cyclase (GGDEF)-like protein